MTDKFNSNLYSNTVIHQRFFPFKHKFFYSLTSLYLDYDELKSLDKKISFFSYNKLNFFSFYEKDHGYRDNRLLINFVKNILTKSSIKYKNLKLSIFCFPRILGYVFNPLSIIYCFDNKNLIGVLYEVKNTSNEQHTYCFADNSFLTKKTYKHRCKKIFYVSPFIEMNSYYKFSINIPSNKISIIIEQFNSNNEKILLASQIGKRIRFTSATIMSSFIKNPLMTFRVILGIHFQAIKIFIKGGKYYKKTKKPVDSISFEGKL